MEKIILKINDLEVIKKKKQILYIEDKALSFNTIQLCGINGCGKSSLLAEIYHNNPSITTNVKNKFITLIPQTVMLFEKESIRNNLLIFNINLDSFIYFFSKFNLDITLDDIIFNLSGGQQQIVHVLIGLLRGGLLFLIDEPFNNIDKERKGIMLDCINALAPHYIITSHNYSIPDIKKIYLENGDIYV